MVKNNKLNKKTRCFQQKKGLERNVIIVMILVVITLGFLVFLLIKVGIDKMPDEEACHEAVIYRGTISNAMKHGGDAGQILDQKAVDMISLKCREKNVVIKSGDRLEVKKEIADEMARCWAMLGEGKINFFGNPLWEEGQRCIVCSKIKFEGEAAKVDKIGGDEFSIYLAENNIPEKQITYSDFLAGASEHLQYQKLEKDPNNKNIANSIDTSAMEGYSVVYTMWTKENWQKTLLSNFAGVAVGVAVPLVACHAVGAVVGSLTFGAGFLINVACMVGAGYAGAYIGSQVNEGVNALDDVINGPEDFVGGIYLVKYNSEGLSSVGGGTPCTSFDSIAE